MSRALVIVLVLVLALLSLPVLVSMDWMEPCPTCDGAGMLVASGLCLAVITLFTLLLPTSIASLRLAASVPRSRLTISGIERPPRSA
ncbi:MAG: hypothetical protein ACRDIZ_07670 [Actinomycetota bacterium]